MTKSIFFCKALVAVALVFATSQTVEAQPTPPAACITAATNICSTICGKLPTVFGQNLASYCTKYGCTTSNINAIATQVQAAAAQCAPTPPSEGAL